MNHVFVIQHTDFSSLQLPLTHARVGGVGFQAA